MFVGRNQTVVKTRIPGMTRRGGKYRIGDVNITCLFSDNVPSPLAGFGKL